MHPSRPGSPALLVVSLLLVLAGGWLASFVQTGGGSVDVRDVRFVGAGGLVMSGHLYVPDGVSAEDPAPGVVAIHGYINSKETQSPYAIEYARRGYVVLAVDQSGHGYSDPPAFANGFGGPDALAYLRTLDIVDPDQIVLEGHSMGGWAVLIAAGSQPDAYTSVVVSGSSTGTLGAPEGTPEFPRNFGLVFSLYDEFAPLMWGAPTADAAPATEKMQTAFGTDAPVEVGELYGSVEDGSARLLYQPAVTHPGDHITTAGVGATIDWVQRTTVAPNPLPATNQVWMWKEFGTFVALLGGLMSLFAIGGVLLRSSALAPLHRAPAAAAGQTGAGWWISAAVLAVVPVLSYFWLQNRTAEWLPTSALLPQNLTTGFVGWALGNGLLALVLFIVWHVASGRRTTTAEGEAPGAATYGLTLPAAGPGLGRALLLALATVSGTYLLLALSDWIFGTDFRVWVVALKPMSALQLRIFLGYLIPFTAFFAVLGLVLHGQLRQRGSGLPTTRAALVNALVVGIGFVALLLVQYVPLLSGAPLPLGEPLLTIVAFQFVVLLPLAALLSTHFFRLTGRIWTGAFVNGLFVTWYIVASQATHYPF